MSDGGYNWGLRLYIEDKTPPPTTEVSLFRDTIFLVHSHFLIRSHSRLRCSSILALHEIGSSNPASGGSVDHIGFNHMAAAVMKSFICRDGGRDIFSLLQLSLKRPRTVMKIKSIYDPPHTTPRLS